MITQLRGVLRYVGEEELTLAVDPVEVAVLIPDHTRRQLQSKVGELVSLHTIFYIEGGQMGSRMTPRLVGFFSAIDREFFEIFCSVDGVGVRKALRAMVRPVRELARTIQDQDVRMLATYPGIGEATAERIVAKLRRKVGKFTLIVGPADAADAAGAGRGQRPGRERRARRDPRHVRRLALGRPHREPGPAGDRPRPRRQEKVQERGRHDRCDLPAEPINR